METIKFMDGRLQIIKEGAVIELDAAEVEQLRGVLEVEASMPAGDLSKWHLEDNGIYYGPEYICSNDPNIFNGSMDAYKKIVAWFLTHQPAIDTMDDAYITAMPSYDVFIYLEEWANQE
jgi:hypothetical protein